MLNISSKGYYSIAALFELALHYNSETVQIKDIADAQSIPQNYLEQLLLRLKNHGYVKSFRGKKGGYALSKSPGQINILEVLTVLEGELDLVNTSVTSDTLNRFWTETEDKIKESLNHSLEDLLNLRQSIKKNVIYHI
ncbi:MAG: Rrf2 family transcriptional regulator [Spirochaetes bacterium]|nr:Rrf2 family transcriptional regulator [Spirochaetota bacterium]